MGVRQWIGDVFGPHLHAWVGERCLHEPWGSLPGRKHRWDDFGLHDYFTRGLEWCRTCLAVRATDWRPLDDVVTWVEEFHDSYWSPDEISFELHTAPIGHEEVPEWLVRKVRENGTT